MKSTIFKYIDRNYRNSIVFIPGWASDYRIFRHLELNFNYLLPTDFSPFTFEKSLLEALRENNIKDISLFGWSLGGFAAADFASKYRDMINEIILVGIRKKYKKEEIEFAKKELKRDKKEYLRKFYTRCFSKREGMRRFRKSLLDDYCEKFSLDYLLETLEYLASAEIRPDLLEGIEKIKIIHGELDRIAPIQESMDIKDSLAQAKFVSLEDRGHALFLEGDVNRYL